MTGPESERLRQELAAHRAALDAFLAAAESVESDAFNLPAAPGKWSPAQVAEHLRLSYATVRAELAGSVGFRIRSGWWQQLVFRVLYLPKILRQGIFPKGVPAVREIRPGDGPFERSQLLAALRDEGRQFEAAAAAKFADPGARVTHPFLGRLDLLDGLRLTAQHVRHHQAQLPPSRARV